MRSRLARATEGDGPTAAREAQSTERRTCTKNSAATAAVPPQPAALVKLLGVAYRFKFAEKDMVLKWERCAEAEQRVS